MNEVEIKISLVDVFKNQKGKTYFDSGSNRIVVEGLGRDFYLVKWGKGSEIVKRRVLISILEELTSGKTWRFRYERW